MTDRLTPALAALLDDPATLKALAVPGSDGTPRLLPVPSLHRGDSGRLHYLERHDSSEANRGLLRAVWFGGRVAVLLSHPDGRAIEITARPHKAHVTGPLFLRHYQEIRAAEGDVGLSAVWEIEPERIIDQSRTARDAAEAARHPGFTHLDRLAV